MIQCPIICSSTMCNEEEVSLDSNAALLNNKARSNRQGSEAITGVT